MTDQTNNIKPLSVILRELDIPTYTGINNPICHSHLMQSQKEENTGRKRVLRMRHLTTLESQENQLIFLRLRDSEFIVTIISQKREKGVF